MWISQISVDLGLFAGSILITIYYDDKKGIVLKLSIIKTYEQVGSNNLSFYNLLMI